MRNRARDDDIRRSAGPKGRYLLDRPVGANRFASLWRGEDASTGQQVLVEVVRSTPPSDPDSARILRDRMAVSQDLPLHPGLLAVRSFHAPEPPGRLAVASKAAVRARARRGVEEQQWLLVLDPFEGSTLDHRAAFGDLSPAAVCAIAAKVGEALGALHAAGVAHGSLSPTTILVSDAGEARVFDAVVGAWWSERAMTLGGAVDRRRDDVVALRRLVTDLLSPVAVPIGVRRLVDPSGDPSLEQLVDALRDAGSSASRSEPMTAPAPRTPEPDTSAPELPDDRESPGSDAPEPAAEAPEPASEPEPEPRVRAPQPEPASEPAPSDVDARADREDPATEIPEVAQQPDADQATDRERELAEERRRERARVEEARRRAEERERRAADARARAEERHAADAAARREEQERRRRAEAEELEREIARQAVERERQARDDVRAPAAGAPPVVVVPDADADADADADGGVTPPRSSPGPSGGDDAGDRRASHAIGASADRPATTVTAAPAAHDGERVVRMPEPPAASPSSYLDWTTVPSVMPSLPSGEAQGRAEPELEPSRWMQVAAIVASLVMFGAIGAAVVYMFQSGS